MKQEQQDGKDKVSNVVPEKSVIQSSENTESRKRDFDSYRKKRSSRFTKTEIDFEREVLGVRRVSRVVAGGRRFSFAAVVIMGDRKGSVGCGTGKAADSAAAINKAIVKAKKRMLVVPLTPDGGIRHTTKAKYCSSTIYLSPSTGLIAGGAPRQVLALAGVKNVNAKILSRSKNAINNARATLKALEMLV